MASDLILLGAGTFVGAGAALAGIRAAARAQGLDVPAARLGLAPRQFGGGIAIVMASMLVGLVAGPAVLSLFDGGTPKARANDDSAALTRLKAVVSPPPPKRLTHKQVRDVRPTARRTYIAQARSTQIALFKSLKATKPYKHQHAMKIEGQIVKLVFLVRDAQAKRVLVDLPTRPNHSKAWVRVKDVTLRANTWRLGVSISHHKLVIFNRGKRVATKPVGLGRAVAPTPLGRYFITDLIKARNPNDVYGPYSFGLSAHSTVLTHFQGGVGQIGLHGTNEPAGLGKNVSHGCIRIANGAITALAKRLPLGTPVDIVR